MLDLASIVLWLVTPAGGPPPIAWPIVLVGSYASIRILVPSES